MLRFPYLSGVLVTLGCEGPNIGAHHVLARETIPVAPTKRKTTNQATTDAETSTLHTIVLQTVVSSEQTPAQTIRADKQVQAQRAAQEKNKAAMINQDIDQFTEDDETQPD